MSNMISEGKDRELPPDQHGEIVRVPTPASAEPRAQVLTASSAKESGDSSTSRSHSSIESRTDLRLAATNEAMRADPVRVGPTLSIEQETARRWADLDVTDFGRIRSETRRENALEAIAGHVRASPEYAHELKKRSPVLADSARIINEERSKTEVALALPTLQSNAATFTFASRSEAGSVAESQQRQFAQQDAKNLMLVPDGSERHRAAAAIGENMREYKAYRDELHRVAPLVAAVSVDAAAERNTVRSVEDRNQRVLEANLGPLDGPSARQIVQWDLEAMAGIKSDTGRHAAAVAMGRTADKEAVYRIELQAQSPQVAKEVQVATATNDRDVADRESRNRAEFGALEAAKGDRAAAWTPAQAADQVRKDVGLIGLMRETDAIARRELLGEMAVNVERSKTYRETLVREAPDIERDVEAQRQRDASERTARAQRHDSLNGWAQSRAALIEAAALASLQAVRSRETARVRDQIALAPEGVTREARESREFLKAPPLDGRVTAPDDPDIAAQRAAAIKRPSVEAELSRAMSIRFIVSHEKRGLLDKGSTEFTFRSGAEQGRVAFVDTGKSLNTERDDKGTIRAMVELATLKNWKEVTVSGTEQFRRQAWLEASVQGLAVRGYEAREADKQLLADLLEQQRKQEPLSFRNAINAVDREQKPEQQSGQARPVPAQGSEVSPQRKHVDGDALTANEKSVLDNSRAILSGRAISEKFTEATLREMESRLRGERVYVGEVVEHGPAPYEFKKDSAESYFVTLKTRSGEQVIWGKGLAEAMKERRVGEEVVLQNIGKHPVTVIESVRNEQGAVVDARAKDTHYNHWKAEPLALNSEQSRAELANRSAPRQPSIGVYDPKAPRQPTRSATPAKLPEQQRNAEKKRPSLDR